MSIRFHEFELEEARRELLRDGNPVALEPRAFDCLRFLIRHRSRAVSKDELQEKVWGTIVGDAAIAQCVTRLRKALDSDVELVRTVRGHGYRFVGTIDEVEAPAEIPVVDVPQDEPRASIAVLPLADLSAEGDREYFADGIAEEILALLSRVPDLRVVSRTSSFAFRDRNLDSRALGKALGADYILEGSVRRQAKRVRVSISLIDAAVDSQLWNRSYDRDMTDMFALQSEIATAIVDELRIGSKGRTRRYDATRNPEAYDFYLRGRYYFHEWDGRAMDHSREMFEKAIDLDPTYAKAWAGLADTLTCQAMWRDWDTDGTLTARAEEASRKAIEFAPELSESQCARGFMLSNLGRHDESYRYFDEAIRLDPRNYEARYLYARARFAAGDAARASSLFAEAAELRQEDYQSRCLEGLAREAVGDSAGAAAAAADGVERCRRHLSLYPDDTRAWTLGSNALVESGQREEGLEWARHALSLAPEDITVLHNVGCAFSKAGLIDEALDVFEKRFAMGSFLADWIDNDPDFDPLRDHPRFLRMIGREKD